MSGFDIARELQSAITQTITPQSPVPQLRTVPQAPQAPDATQGLIDIFDKELARAQAGQDQTALINAYNNAGANVSAADAGVTGAIRSSAKKLAAVNPGPVDAATVLEQQALAQPRLDNSADTLAANQNLIEKQAAIAEAQRVARQKLIQDAGVDPTQTDSLISQELRRIGTFRVAIQNQEKSVVGAAFAALLSGGQAGADAQGNILGVSQMEQTQKQIEGSYSLIRAATSAANAAIPFAEMVAADSLGGAVDEQKKVAMAKAVDDYNRAQNEVRAGKISESRINTLLAESTFNRNYNLAKDQGQLAVQAAQANAATVRSAADYAIGAAKASIEKRSGILSAISSRIGIAERQDKQALEANALYVANSKRVQLGLEAITPAAFKMMQPKEKQEIMDQGASVAFGGTFDDAMGMIQSIGFNPERMRQQGNAKDAAQLQLFQQAVSKELGNVMAVDPTTGAPKNPDAYNAFKKLTQEQRVRAVAAKLQDEWNFQASDMAKATDDNPRKINFKTYAMLKATRPELVKPLTDAGVVDDIINMNGPENINKPDVLPKAFDALAARVRANPAAMDTEVQKFTDTFTMLNKLQAQTSGYPQYGLGFSGAYNVNIGDGTGKKAQVVSFTNPAQVKAVLSVRAVAADPRYGMIFGTGLGLGGAMLDLPGPPRDTRSAVQRLAEDN